MEMEIDSPVSGKRKRQDWEKNEDKNERFVSDVTKHPNTNFKIDPRLEKNVTILPSLPPPLERCIAEQCYECGSFDIVEDWKNGHDVCRSCGLVLKERIIDVESEWRTFLDDESGRDKSRVDRVQNPLFEASVLTNVGRGASDGMAAAIARRHKIGKLSVADSLLLDAIHRIEKLCERLRIHGAVINRAKEIFKAYADVVTNDSTQDGNRVPRRRVLKTSEIDDIVAGSVFHACRVASIPRTMKEICVASRLTKKDVGMIVRRISSALPESATNGNVSICDYAAHFCNLLGLPNAVRSAAQHLAARLETVADLSSRSPTTLAAFSVYVICGLSGSEYSSMESQVPDVTGVAKITITKTLKVIEKKLSEYLPEGFDTQNSVKKLFK